ncbi:MAG: hypothetical protein MJZ34_04705 [Paludibacteraceae bacterium]|nr:hypothetical protein [Paludibacteraceae bacterium]
MRKITTIIFTFAIITCPLVYKYENAHQYTYRCKNFDITLKFHYDAKVPWKIEWNTITNSVDSKTESLIQYK